MMLMRRNDRLATPIQEIQKNQPNTAKYGPCRPRNGWFPEHGSGNHAILYYSCNELRYQFNALQVNR